MDRTPILLLAYRRASATRAVLARIRRVRPAKLYVACDGARRDRPGDGVRVQRVRDCIRAEVDWDCELHTLFRDTHLGCRKAVSGAIDWLFEHEDRGIIIEDDCLPDPSFFPYCEQLLRRYRHDSRVMHISGCNHISCRPRYDYWFSRYIQVWGWATWRRAWKLYDVDMKSFPAFRDAGLMRHCFRTREERRFFLRWFAQIYASDFDTWDVQWFFACVAHSGLAVIPRKNLVENIGFGTEATHTRDPNDKRAHLRAGSLALPLQHPPFMVPRADYDHALFKHTYAVPALRGAVHWLQWLGGRILGGLPRG